MSAIRLARAATGREPILKFAGAYHGHVDGLLAEAGSGMATPAIPASARRPRGGHGRRRSSCRGTTPTRSSRATERARVRGDPRRALSGEHGPRPAACPASSSCLRERADANGALLVFDEVITGFRVARRRRPGARPASLPDLTVMGKVIGGGLPAAAYGGSRELMQRIAPAGDVYQAGTLSGNPLAVAAGLATLAQARRRGLRAAGGDDRALAAGLREAAGDRPV